MALDQEKILELENRRLIYNIIVKYAGSHYREIERKSMLSSGVVKYHLGYLLRHNLVTIQKVANTITYFPKQFSSDNFILMSLLRQRSIRIILLSILMNKDITHEEIVAKSGISPSTVSWHLKKLQENNILRKEISNKRTKYFLMISEKDIMGLLIVYKESFMDTLVDRIIEMWG